MLSTVQSNLEATWPDDVARFMFSFEMVDEMVECCDAADENLEVLNSVAKNKKEGAEAEADENTTIGFGGGGEKGPVLAAAPSRSPRRPYRRTYHDGRQEEEEGGQATPVGRGGGGREEG